jgi:hypothetical protein
VDVSGLPAPAATAVRESIFGAVVVAHRIHSPALLQSARMAFVHGMDLALLVSGFIALVGIVLAAIFMPRSSVVNSPRPRLPEGSARLLAAADQRLR